MGYKICSDCGAHLDPGEQCDCCDVATSKKEDPVAGERTGSIVKTNKAIIQPETRKIND